MQTTTLERHTTRLPCADCASKVFVYGHHNGRPLCSTCWRYANNIPVCAGCCNPIKVQRDAYGTPARWVHTSGKRGGHPITPLAR